MEAVKLSIVALLFKWATYCVDWFMDFFAEPENYWVAETYPSDASVVTVTKAYRAKVKSIPKLTIWLKEHLNEHLKNPFIIAQIKFKQAFLNLCEVWTATYFSLFGTVFIALNEDDGSISV